MGDWLDEPVLLTGATGFVGRRLYPLLRSRGYEILCGARVPQKARREWPRRRWVRLDVEEPSTLSSAMSECGSAFYLIHQMSGGGEYGERERR